MGRTAAAGVVVKDGRSPGKQDLLGYLEGKIAKWWMPDDVVFVDEIPHTATGKIQKTTVARSRSRITVCRRE
jgi:fatty-acyl-CoA synthase